MKSRVPKVLHRICGKAMVGHVVDAAEAGGFAKTLVVLPPGLPEAETVLGNGVSYVEQPEPLGSGHALLQARRYVDGIDHVAVLSGDVPLIRPETIAGMMRHHVESGASVTLLTADMEAPGDLGRLVRDDEAQVSAVVEQQDADSDVLAVTEINAGVYCFNASWLWQNIDGLSPSANGEVYLTDLVSMASRQGAGVASVTAEDTQETLGVNTRVQLAEAEAVMRQRVRERWMLAGVTMPDPASVYIDCAAELGQDTAVFPNTHIVGASRVGQECEIGPNSIIDGCVIGDRCRVVASVLEGSTLEDEVEVGPFSHVRPGTHLEREVHVGSYAELTRSRLGRGTKSGHFSYIGDAEVGANVNIGAGTVTCNFDGTEKHRTVIGDGAFIGSDSMLVAPVSIGPRAKTGAGAVVTKDVPADSLAKGVPARVRPKPGSSAES
jgi:bifunctional UDP-N-acetylglucosamine pyrophosphorylase/glucosamine-1-phosphate N-acetyltransferase